MSCPRRISSNPSSLPRNMCGPWWPCKRTWPRSAARPSAWCPSWPRGMSCWKSPTRWRGIVSRPPSTPRARSPRTRRWMRCGKRSGKPSWRNTRRPPRSILPRHSITWRRRPSASPSWTRKSARMGAPRTRSASWRPRWACCRAPMAPRSSAAARRRRWPWPRWLPPRKPRCWTPTRAASRRSASCCTIISRPSPWARPAAPAPRAAARSATARWRSAPWSQWCLRKRTSRMRSGSRARSWNRTARPPWPASARACSPSWMRACRSRSRWPASRPGW